MATAVSPTPAKQGSRLKLARNILLGLAALAALLIWWNWASIKGQAQVGTAYGAHIACSCRYIEGRDLGSCESDFEDGMGMISLSDDSDSKRVTASVLFLAEAAAERRGAYGCVLLNEQELEAAG